jgi:hypothetical protein
MKLSLMKWLTQILYENEPNNKPILNSDQNGKLRREHGQILWDFFDLALANWMVEYLMNRYCRSGSHYPALGCWTLLALIFYCGIAHLLMKGWQEAMHPVPIIWLVCESVRDLVHLLGADWLLYRVKWLTRTWFPPIELRLRLMNAFEWLAKRKISNDTKNFKRACIASNPFLFIALIYAQ